jgi:DNA-binding LytR/AlgR family response regulator
MVKVTISEIRYIEAMSEYLKIFIEGEVKPIVTLLSMKKMEEKLPENFMCIHRSYIVNLTKIQEINKNRIIMDAETFLPIGDMYKEAFQRFIDAKFLGKA